MGRRRTPDPAMWSNVSLNDRSPYITQPRSRSPRRWLRTLAGGLLVLLLVAGAYGVACGPATPAPPPQTVTRTVLRTPPSCIRALDLARDGLTRVKVWVDDLNAGDFAQARADSVTFKAWSDTHAGQLGAANADCRAHAG